MPKKDRSQFAYFMHDIPLDDAGREFLKQMRQYINYDRYRIKLHGSGPRA